MGSATSTTLSSTSMMTAGLQQLLEHSHSSLDHHTFCSSPHQKTCAYGGSIPKETSSSQRRLLKALHKRQVRDPQMHFDTPCSSFAVDHETQDFLWALHMRGVFRSISVKTDPLFTHHMQKQIDGKMGIREKGGIIECGEERSELARLKASKRLRDTMIR